MAKRSMAAPSRSPKLGRRKIGLAAAVVVVVLAAAEAVVVAEVATAANAEIATDQPVSLSRSSDGRQQPQRDCYLAAGAGAVSCAGG